MENFAVPRRLETFLLSLPNVHGSHSTLSLLDHLKGTYATLKGWDSPDHVCVAGLFHSIYGTQAYHSVSLTPSNRKLLENLIGTDSEALVHAFHSANWSELLSDDTLLSEAERETPGLSELAVANLVEQVSRIADRLDADQRQALLRAATVHLVLKGHVSGSAFRCLEAVIEDLS